MRKILSILFLWLTILYAYGQQGNYTVNLDREGTLREELEQDDLKAYSGLTVTGPMNGTDIRYLRQLFYKKEDGEVPATLDLSRTHIVALAGQRNEYCPELRLMSNIQLFYTNTEDGVLGEAMFYEFAAPQLIFLPKGATSLKRYALARCYSLENVIVPEGVDSIGFRAFYYDKGLTETTLPKELLVIEDEAFYGCTSLLYIECLSAEPPKIGNKAFSDIYATCTLVVPEGSSGRYRQAEGWHEFRNIIESEDAPNSISLSATNHESTACVRFNLCGQYIANARQGLSLKRRHDGKVIKVITGQ